MILRRPFATREEIDDIDIDGYHVESAYVASDDLSKRIIRVKTDHGNEYGIRLDDDAPALERGMLFEVGDGRLLAIETIPDRMLVVRPRSMDEMGRIAHYLGNLHKPVEVADGAITLLYDPVVDRDLVAGGVIVEVHEMELDHPLRHIDLAKLSGAHHDGHHHGHADAHRHDGSYTHEHAHTHTYAHTHPHEHGPEGHHHPVRHLEEDAAEAREHHRENEDLRELQRDEWRALHEREHHEHRERIVREDAERIGERPYHHPVRHLEEDVEELRERHEDHRELREMEREERWALDEAEHPHHHHAHKREDGR